MNNLSAAEKGKITETRVLKWLFEFEYSNADILEKATARSKSAINKALKRMEFKKLIKSHKPQILRHKIWGITLNGVSRIAEDDYDENRVFNFNKFNEFSALHHYDIQRVKLYIRKNGFNFYHTRRSFIGTKGKVPDGIMETKRGNVAIEVERTMKSTKRYQQIWGEYVKDINDGKYIAVNYFLTDKESYKLKGIFDSTNKLILNDKSYKFNGHMKSNFDFAKCRLG